FDLVISHSGECYHNEEGVEVAGEPVSGTPTIIYEIYNSSGTVVAEGTKTAPVKVPLEVGKYYVKAYATHTGYIDSDYMADDEEHCASLPNAFTVHRSPNFYVSKNGNNGTYNGSKNKPYRTIQKCIDQIREVAQLDPTDNNYTIILQSDITSDPANDTVETLAEFTKTGVSSEDNLIYNIAGNGYTIDAAGKTLAMKISTGTEVILDNVNITGAGIEVDSGTLDFASGSVKEVSSNTSGSAIKASSGEVKLGTDSLVTISGNSSTASENPCAVYIGGTAELNVSKAVIYGNTDAAGNKANLYLAKNGDAQKVMNVRAPLTGSRIGIQTESEPGAGTFITFTSSYGFNGGYNDGVTPGTYFEGDAEGVGFDEESGEAVLAKNGGGINVNVHDDVKFALDTVYIPFRTEKTFTVTVTKSQTVGTETTETDITSECSDFNYTLSYFGEDIGNSYYTPTNTNKVTAKNNLRSSSYVLSVSCKYNGAYYSQEIEVFVRTVEELYVSNNGDDTKDGKSASTALKTFGRVLKVINESNSMSFFTVHVTGTVQLGDITDSNKTNELTAGLVSLTLDGSPSATINGDSNTVITSNVKVPVQLEDVAVVCSSTATAISLGCESENLVLKGSSTITGKVQLAKMGCIILDSTYTAEGTVEVVPASNDSKNRQIISGSTTEAMIKKFNSASSNWGIDRTGKLGAPMKSAPNAVGDIVLNNGKAIAYNYRGKLTLAQKTDAIAVIFYAGGNSELGNRVLGVGYNAFSNDTALNYLKNNYDSNLWFNNGALDWCSGFAEGFNDKVPALIDKVDGSTAYEDFKAYVGSRFRSDAPYYYAAFYWAYELYPRYYRSRLASYTSGWYLPTLKEFEALYPNLNTVNMALTAIGAEELSGQWYWTASLPASDGADGQQVMWYNLLENHSGWCHKNGAPNEKNWHISLAIRRFN
ncbi:MAG: hypothetical protein K6B17_00855, partial [Treponema sp.]|nr:hypothetical protein [Treponema sp.]